MKFQFLFVSLLSLFISCQAQKPASRYEVVIRHGLVYDGSGAAPVKADIGVNRDTIAFIGDLSAAVGNKEIDAGGLAVSPGFINMLSWSDAALLEDPRAMSDIKQGVTLEIFGEGWSPGPKRDSTRREPWKSLGDYFSYLQRKGAAPNFGSFVGATTIRKYVLGDDNIQPTPQQLTEMKSLVKRAMQEGAMGLGTSLIYAPADYASTEELIELSKVASGYGGMYITHMRSEGDKVYAGLAETFRIAREANIHAEIYHLKVTQKWNWKKADTIISKIDSARRAGLNITANMYPYHASSTNLVARLPTWVQDGGPAAMRKRLVDPQVRKRLLRELELGIPSKNSDPQFVMILGFRTDSLNKLYRGKRLDAIARLHGKNADETMLDLLVKDRSLIPSIFFVMNEENVRKMLLLPFVSIGSDAPSRAAEKPFTDGGTHPRVYGTFARFLGKYVRDEKLMSMEEGIRRMTSLPAANLKIKRRGSLQPGYYADMAIFDPRTFIDHSTFEDSHQYATGMVHVFVNGIQVLKDGLHTMVFPGKVVRGPGWKK